MAASTCCKTKTDPRPCREDGTVLKEGDNAVHSPDRRKGRNGEEPITVKEEGREAGVGSIEVGRGLWGEQAEPALRGDTRLMEAPMIP